jgi:dTDP-4-dehydrorhamnose reductase
VKAFVFGSTGMLGHAVVSELRAAGIHTVTVARSGSDIVFDQEKQSVFELALGLEAGDYLINCIGLISHLIDEKDPASRARASNLNSLLPNELVALAESKGARLIQIATDCVFSGSTGSYSEDSPHDASGVYGKSKSMGEVDSPNAMHLRVSIIGKELRGKQSLLEWVLGQPKDSTIPGYTDRIWNGITTKAFGRLIVGIISKDGFIPGVTHVLPADKVSKFELVSMIASSFDRSDISVEPAVSGEEKDLTLATNRPETNRKLWIDAGYKQIPSIQELLGEISS